ncbi:MAG: beta-lactamase domain protein [Solirubrobacterales bacterium]|nr:beta-lactamase domain protein [Solirubrobacterales bacterium]
MLFRQIVNEDLGCASYLVGDPKAGVAAVVDPHWDIEPYLRLSRLHGVRIEHILETHTHADHVSGHGRLARATGAAIHVSSLAGAEYEHEPFEDGWKLDLGSVEIEAVHTPGHRPEHTSFVLRDESRGDEPWAVLSGDSLFVGDVARPDLAVEPHEGAADIFRSLHERLMKLPDEVEVWPGHLGGSLCGSSNLDHKSSSTIGYEREHNRALGFSEEEEFVADAVASIGSRPPNVEHIVGLNRGPLVEELGHPAPLAPRAVEDAIAGGAVLIDARTNEQFDEAHVPGAISASSYETGFATKVARVVTEEAPLIVVAASDGYELEAADQLASIGLSVTGYLRGGMTAWRSEGRPVERIELIDTAQLAERLGDDGPVVLDVRDADEFAEGHIPGSVHIPFGDLPARLDEVPRDGTIAAICSGGKRSGLAASVLQRGGFDVIHVAHGGVGTWRADGRPIESDAGG